MMKQFKSTVLAVLLIYAGCQAQDFSKFFTFGPANPFAGTSFISSHELKDSSGFLILGDRYTTYRNGFVIKTDADLNEVWTTRLDFQNAQFPYDNINFTDIGELLNGNIYVYGVAGPGNTIPHYVLFILDTAGQIIHHTALYDSLGSVNGANITTPKFGDDSTIIIPISSYDEFGFFRLDYNLNLLSYSSYTTLNMSLARGRDCTMLHDSTMLVHSAVGLAKTDLNGNIIWSKEYTGIGQFFSVLETASGSIYASAYANAATGNAAIAKFDSAGNPVFLKIYNMAPMTTTSPGWQIYQHGNDLMLYSDSVMFRVDTNGNVIGWGKTVDAYNYKIMKPGLNNKFTLTGQIMQDSTGWYEYTLMRFDDSTDMGCLHPRAIVTTNGSMLATNSFPVVQNYLIVRDTISFAWNTVNLDFDAVNGCPDNSLSIEDQERDELPGLFPNPTSDQVHIRTTEPNQVVQIYDCFGREITAVRSGSDSSVTVEVADWAEGIYMVVIEGSASAPFVVMH